LVCGLLFTVLIGMLQYGLYFNDALGTRSGVREAVRQGVVRNTSLPGCSTGNDVAKLRCYTDNQIDALTGDTYVKIVPPGSWDKGATLRVCAAVHSDGVVGLLPLPNGGWIMAKTEMSVEETTPAFDGGTAADSMPASGPGWNSWCPS
jgi:hypothetical protein